MHEISQLCTVMNIYDPPTRPWGVQPVLDVKDLLIFGASVSFFADFVVLSDFLLKEMDVSLISKLIINKKRLHANSCVRLEVGSYLLTVSKPCVPMWDLIHHSQYYSIRVLRSAFSSAYNSEFTST